MNIKKIGLTALAGSLVATSVFAGEMTVSGSAALNWEGQDKTTSGNTFRMADSITFSGGGELDNGWTIAASFELDQGAADNKAAQTGGAASTDSGPFDSHSITLGMLDLGSITFSGHGGDGAMGAVDDVMPTAYEETFDILNTSTTAGGAGVAVQTAVAGVTTIASASGDNMFSYNNSSLVDGVSVTISYLPSDATYTESSTDFAIAYSGVEGLTVGYAQGENGLSGTSAIDSETMYIKYAYGPVTVGYQRSEQDANGTTNDDEYTSMGVSYAVNDSLSISYGVSEYDDKNTTTDQENTAIGFSYTMGSMTLAGAHAKVENQGHSAAAVNDITGYELNLSFAF